MKIDLIKHILFAFVLISCGNNDDETAVLVETWKLQSLEAGDFYDFNGDLNFSEDIVNELNCMDFDTYFLYSDGTGEEQVTKNIALFFDASTSSVQGICENLSETQRIPLTWSVNDNTRTFNFQGLSAMGTIIDNQLIFEQIDFPLYTDNTLTSIELFQSAKFTYILQE
ncbi:hypothetical protein RM697_00570 [Ichthyenterobacterium sp. W332]|uniref:Lipocalin-like domain-containing protein n=1 Tax=Microcosmobacter mediterraneus TaxID=3075607 RepID=A0ABU2YH41_9FLAO|nr:hypothetical protein [Ichthyenterobacterium sp. W332]MDT0557117.1 hypothetical protein [Ichthyenterobacterium sp. W332]